MRHLFFSDYNLYDSFTKNATYQLNNITTYESLALKINLQKKPRIANHLSSYRNLIALELSNIKIKKWYDLPTNIEKLLLQQTTLPTEHPSFTFNKLKDLELDDFTANSLTSLMYFPYLKRLTCPLNKLYNPRINLVNLTELNLTINLANYETINLSELCPNITKLSILINNTSYEPMDSIDLQKLQNIIDSIPKTLTYLNITDSTYCNTSIDISAFTNLTELHYRSQSGLFSADCIKLPQFIEKFYLYYIKSQRIKFNNVSHINHLEVTTNEEGFNFVELFPFTTVSFFYFNIIMERQIFRSVFPLYTRCYFRIFDRINATIYQTPIAKIIDNLILIINFKNKQNKEFILDEFYIYKNTLLPIIIENPYNLNLELFKIKDTSGTLHYLDLDFIDNLDIETLDLSECNALQNLPLFPENVSTVIIPNTLNLLTICLGNLHKKFNFTVNITRVTPLLFYNIDELHFSAGFEILFKRHIDPSVLNYWFPNLQSAHFHYWESTIDINFTPFAELLRSMSFNQSNIDYLNLGEMKITNVLFSECIIEQVVLPKTLKVLNINYSKFELEIIKLTNRSVNWDEVSVYINGVLDQSYECFRDIEPSPDNSDIPGLGLL